MKGSCQSVLRLFLKVTYSVSLCERNNTKIAVSLGETIWMRKKEISPSGIKKYLSRNYFSKKESWTLPDSSQI